MKRFFQSLLGSAQRTVAPDGAASQQAPSDQDDALWQAAFDARAQVYTQHFGPLPADILKMISMTGVWPGGGLYALAATRLGEGLWVHTTFGLSNADMPAGVRSVQARTVTDAHGAAVSHSARLQASTPAAAPDAAAGYGYELLVITRGACEWPLSILQWVVNAEIQHNIGLLARVEANDALTVEAVGIGDGESVNLFIAPAQAPLPAGADLPNGRLTLLVATVITDEEMQWALAHGRAALLQRLMACPVGQCSDRERPSVV